MITAVSANSHDFQREVQSLGLAQAPSSVCSPECNDNIERSHRTLQEQVFDLHVFQSLEEARPVMTDFFERYSSEWLIGRLSYLSPKEHRRQFEENVFCMVISLLQAATGSR